MACVYLFNTGSWDDLSFSATSLLAWASRAAESVPRSDSGTWSTCEQTRVIGYLWRVARLLNIRVPYIHNLYIYIYYIIIYIHTIYCIYMQYLSTCLYHMWLCVCSYVLTCKYTEKSGTTSLLTLGVFLLITRLFSPLTKFLQHDPILELLIIGIWSAGRCIHKCIHTCVRDVFRKLVALS
jgi:hypothetical protein